jgi:hypothetical protein
MAGLPNKGFETKIKHFAQPWKYAEGQVVCQFEIQQWGKAVTGESRPNDAVAP